MIGEDTGCQASSSTSHNIFMGHETAKYISTSCRNIWLGCRAGGVQVSYTNDNIFLGAFSGCMITNGDHNIFLGNYAGRSTTNGCNNIVFGYNACTSSATACSEFVVGISTGKWIHGDQSFNVGVGTHAPTNRARLHVEGSVHATRFFQNPTTLDTSETFPADGGTAVNGGVYGPYTVASGATLTISSGSTFTIL